MPIVVAKTTLGANLSWRGILVVYYWGPKYYLAGSLGILQEGSLLRLVNGGNKGDIGLYLIYGSASKW